MYAGTFNLVINGIICINCPLGSYSASKAMFCRPWANCTAGEYISAQGTATTDRSCTDCGKGAGVCFGQGERESEREREREIATITTTTTKTPNEGYQTAYIILTFCHCL
jgi:hypothetical protein